MDFNDPDFALKREEKTIGGARYGIVNVFEQQTFWSAVYTRAGTPKPVLEVYSEGACREAAERILRNLNEGGPQDGGGGPVLDAAGASGKLGQFYFEK